jgi:hypothetical protein
MRLRPHWEHFSVSLLPYREKQLWKCGATQFSPLMHAYVMTANIPLAHLRPSERRFAAAMRRLGYGRFECLRIGNGDLILDPWPTTVRTVKFGNPTANHPAMTAEECELKQQITDFFSQVRSIDIGGIRVLEVRGGLSFSAEIANEKESDLHHLGRTVKNL